MINPRTGPYTTQRLVAVTQELTRSLSNVKLTLPLSTELQKEMPLAIIESDSAVAESGMMINTSMFAPDLTSALRDNAVKTKSVSSSFSYYLPYIFGGAIVTIGIYLYFHSRRAKEEEINQGRLKNAKKQFY
jgi:hypothetical protein